MKQTFKYFILMFILIIVETTNLKFAQLNYKDQYEQVISINFSV